MTYLFPVQRVLGILLMLFSLTMLAPATVDLWYQEGSARAFVVSFALLAGVGLLAWLPVRRHRAGLNLKEAFLIVVLAWSVVGVAGALPLYLLAQPQLTLSDAVFEALSGLTTTGATVLTGLDSLPRAVLFYRQFLQWLGGLGIIVIAIAIAPVLGIGGMQLYRTNLLSDTGDTRLMPRIGDTARGLLGVYLPVDGAVRGGLFSRRDAGVRRAGTCFLDHCDRRFFDARRQLRPLCRIPGGCWPWPSSSCSSPA